MKKKSSRKEILHMILRLLLFAAAAFAVWMGVSYFRGRSANRIYGKAEKRRINALIRERKDWENAAFTVKNAKAPDPAETPEPAEPYLVILLGKWDRADDRQSWQAIACSEKDPADLDGIKTVIFCQYTEETRSYGPAGTGSATTTGTSEFVRISYVNAATGKCYKWEKFGKELPGQTSRVPHYKVSANKLLSHIKESLNEQ